MRGEAPLGGTGYVLRFDFNAFAAVEDVTGKTLNEVLSDIGRNSMTATRALTWAGLRHEKLTLEDVGNIISDVGFKDLTEAIRVALLSALPDVAQNPQKRAKAGRS